MVEMPILPICALTWYLPASRRLFPIKIFLCPNVQENGGAQDHVLFQRLMKDLKEEKQKRTVSETCTDIKQPRTIRSPVPQTG